MDKERWEELYEYAMDTLDYDEEQAREYADDFLADDEDWLYEQWKDEQREGK